MTIEELERRINLLDLVRKEHRARIIGNDEWRVNPCPVCGHKDHFTIYKKTNTYSSFSKCCQGGGVYQYLQEVKGLSKEEAYEELKRLANQKTENKKGTPKLHSTIAKLIEVPQSNYPDDINVLYQKQTDRDRAYYIKRGLRKELIERYKLCIEHTEKGNYAVIPYWDNEKVISYNKRALEGQKPKYLKPKGIAPLFNGYYLKTASKGEVIIITEGEIDALSLESLGFKAIGLGGITHVNKLKKAIKETPNAKNLVFFTAFDNDEAGRSATNELPYKSLKIPPKYKDINDWYCADEQAADNIKQQIDLLIAEIEKECKEQLKEYQKLTAAAYINDFMNGISESVNTPSISTGFKNLDEVLDGGLYEGLYILGAISSLGKTSWLLQVCDQIAQQEQDILYFSLEMSRTELMAKSISRLSYLLATDKKHAKTARGVTSGKRWQKYSADETELLTFSMAEYSKYADRLYISEGLGEIGVTQIAQTVKKHVEITGNKPVVAIDYLQILTPYDVRASDKQNIDKAVLELKRLSREYKIPVVAISSLNRANYNNGINMAAFKESGAVEYSSDVLIGLQLKGQGENGFKVDEAKAKNPREIELKILKNRNGATGKNVLFEYNPLFNYFVERGKSDQKPKRRTL